MGNLSEHSELEERLLSHIENLEDQISILQHAIGIVANQRGVDIGSQCYALFNKQQIRKRTPKRFPSNG